MNDLSSINPADLNPLVFPSSASLSSLDGGASFNSLVDQMLADPSTATPKNARLAFAEAQQADNLALGGMFQDPSTSLGLAAGLGGGDLFALPAWAYQAASLSGDPQIESLINLYNQESSLVQNQLLGGNSTGLLGGGSGLFDGLA
jgi:hypothetical protein